MDINEFVEDTSLIAHQEDRLTKLFLNGELTFSEYSSRMDLYPDIDLQMTESDASRRTIGFDHVAVQKIMEPKPHKANNRCQLCQLCQKRKRRVLPRPLRRLMGEATLRYGKGEIKLPTQICMEIIRLVPSGDPEPFRMLAMIYQDDQPEKSLQFALIAAYLSPKNADEWIRLAILSEKSGDMTQAITCYSKAIQASPENISLHEERARLQRQIRKRRLESEISEIKKRTCEDIQN
ncbi:general transcription factor 3C polypeptide 3-like [Temnothorax longispinosus]|uniref:Uncharacterized protein n=1 Tax=Temnothorax longispinosus TaxID=300112 RepID=A0A4S2KS23_9HYME|nr:Uncharacterized protein DBV15_11645 [Temnothorax longispinosus]